MKPTFVLSDFDAASIRLFLNYYVGIAEAKSQDFCVNLTSIRLSNLKRRIGERHGVSSYPADTMRIP